MWVQNYRSDGGIIPGIKVSPNRQAQKGYSSSFNQRDGSEEGYYNGDDSENNVDGPDDGTVVYVQVKFSKKN